MLPALFWGQKPTASCTQTVPSRSKQPLSAMDMKATTAATKAPNTRLLALFNTAAGDSVSGAVVSHNAAHINVEPVNVTAPSAITLKPSVKKFLDYAETGGPLDHYPPYGLANLMPVPSGQMQAFPQPRLRSGRYKDDTYARCWESATTVHGLALGSKLCFRCKGTMTVCNGASTCCFGGEIFLATSSKPCGMYGCNLAIVPKVSGCHSIPRTTCSHAMLCPRPHDR